MSWHFRVVWCWIWLMERSQSHFRYARQPLYGCGLWTDRREFVICVGQQFLSADLFADLCFCSDSFLPALSECGFVASCPCAMVSCACIFFPVPRLHTVPGARPSVVSPAISGGREEAEQRNCCKPLKVMPVTTSPLYWDRCSGDKYQVSLTE